MTLSNVTDVNLSQLHGAVLAMRQKGYRFVTMTCLDRGTTYDVLYHFDKQYELNHLRLALPKGETLPSISDLFFAATLVENEIKDLFGLALSGLAIDYQGRFILAEGAPKTPLNKECGMAVDVRVKAPAAGQRSPGA